jgi:hypothetical protein
MEVSRSAEFTDQWMKMGCGNPMIETKVIYLQRRC